MNKLALYALIAFGVAIGALIVLGIFGEFFRPQNDYCEFAEEYAIAVEGARTSREITEASVDFVSKVGGIAADPIPGEIRESAENLIGRARSVASGATPDLVDDTKSDILRNARRLLQECGMEPVVRVQTDKVDLNS